MPNQPTVAAVRTRPQTVLEDIARLCDLAGMPAVLTLMRKQF